ISDKLLEIEARIAEPIDTAGRRSATWGQPWLTAAIKMRRRGESGGGTPQSETKTPRSNPRSEPGTLNSDRANLNAGANLNSAGAGLKSEIISLKSQPGRS